MTTAGEVLRLPLEQPHRLDIPAKYAELRERQPMAWVELSYGGSGWLVTRYADVKQSLSDPRLSRAATVGADVPRTAPARTRPGGLLSMDGSEHGRLRKLVASTFSLKRIQHWRPRTEQVVAELITGMRAKGAPVDLVDNFSLPLPVTVICELLGVPAKDRHFFQHFSTVALSTTAATAEEVETANTTLQDYLREHIADHRKNPADDLLTDLISARDEQDRLSEEELVTMGVTILVAGHETTANTLSNFVYTLLSTGLWADLVAEPDLLNNAVEELLRFIPLGSAGGGQSRIATEDLEIGGQLVRKGEAVLSDTMSANHDESVFAEPGGIDFGRPTNPHVAFGFGIHHCLGVQLARMELRVGLGSLLAEFPGLRFAESADEVSWRLGTLIRGPKEMPLSW